MQIKFVIYMLERRFRILWDKLRGVDFITFMPIQQSGISGQIGNHYSSSAGFKELKKVIVQLRLDRNKGIFDYGCGKGAILVFFSKLGFRKVAGIELSERLLTICKNNLKRLKLREIKVFLGNAVSFDQIDEYDYFYFYNPFPFDIMESVIANIGLSYERKPRTILIMYCNPVCHNAIVKQVPFKLLKTFPSEISNRTINVYKLLNTY